VAAGLITGVMVSAVLLPFFWLAIWRNPRLVLSGTGVEVHQLGMYLETPWENVAALHWQGGLGLVTSEPLAGSGAGRQAAFGGAWVAGAPLQSDEVGGLIAERRYIPLDAFSHWLHHGDLAPELARRAPWLARELEAAVTQPRVPVSRRFLQGSDGQPLPRRNVVAIVVVIGLAAGLAVLHEAGPPELAENIDRLAALVVAIALGGYALVNFAAAASYLRRGEWFPGLLWGAAAVVMLLLALAALGALVAAS
jgi:hypothetical protein